MVDTWQTQMDALRQSRPAPTPEMTAWRGQRPEDRTSPAMQAWQQARPALTPEMQAWQSQAQALRQTRPPGEHGGWGGNDGGGMPGHGGGMSPEMLAWKAQKDALRATRPQLPPEMLAWRSQRPEDRGTPAFDTWRSARPEFTPTPEMMAWRSQMEALRAARPDDGRGGGDGSDRPDRVRGPDNSGPGNAQMLPAPPTPLVQPPQSGRDHNRPQRPDNSWAMNLPVDRGSQMARQMERAARRGI